jgi:hypothetical protein
MEAPPPSRTKQRCCSRSRAGTGRRARERSRSATPLRHASIRAKGGRWRSAGCCSSVLLSIGTGYPDSGSTARARTGMRNVQAAGKRRVLRRWCKLVVRVRKADPRSPSTRHAKARQCTPVSACLGQCRRAQCRFVSVNQNSFARARRSSRSWERRPTPPSCTSMRARIRRARPRRAHRLVGRHPAELVAVSKPAAFERLLVVDSPSSLKPLRRPASRACEVVDGIDRAAVVSHRSHRRNREHGLWRPRAHAPLRRRPCAMIGLRAARSLTRRAGRARHCARDGWPAELDDSVRLSKSSH